MNELEVVLLDKLSESLLLGIVITARVDDNGFAGLVPKDVTIDGQRVEFETFDFHFHN
jgi:hypothetical protein